MELANTTVSLPDLLTNVTTTTERNIRILTDEELDDILDVMFWVHGVAYPILGIIGVLANILNIVTLSRSVKLVTYKIFLGMACADLVINITLLGYSFAFCSYRPVRILIGSPPNLEPGVTYSLYVWKSIWFHLMNIFMCISNWCAVLVATFRLLVITFPLRAVTYASPSRVNVAIVLVYICGFIVQIPSWLPYSFNEEGAMVQNKELTTYESITVVCSGLLPMSLCAVLTALLLLQISRSQLRIKGSLRKDQLAERLKDQRQLTVTLLLVVCFFLLTSSPTTVYWLMDQNHYFDNHHISRYTQNLFYFGASASVAVNYTGNFFIYILANSSFRKDLQSVLAKVTSVCRKRGRRVSSASTARMLSTTHSSDQQTENTIIPMQQHRGAGCTYARETRKLHN